MTQVSVILPTYNQASYLKGAIDSVLNQTYRDFELIIVDDGSTDPTRRVVPRLQGLIHYLYQTHQGRPRAANAGADKARGKYIAFLDADDLWKPDRLERGVQILDERPDIGLIHGEVEMIDASNRFMPRETDQIKRIYEEQRKKHCDYLVLLHRYTLLTSTVLFRRDCIHRVGLYDPNPAFDGREDYDWYLRFSLHYRIHLMEGPAVAQYRLHEGNIFSRRDSRTLAQTYIAILEKQLNLMSQSLTGGEYRKVRSRILAKLAEFYAERHEKKQVRTRLFDALRLDPTVAFDRHSLKRLIVSFF